MVNALFGLTITGDEVMRSPTPDSLAHDRDRLVRGRRHRHDLLELGDVIA